jgi:hypothetical protein
MVDEKPTAHIESNPTNTQQDTEVADRLRDGLSPKTPQLDFSPSATAANAAKPSDIFKLSNFSKTSEVSKPVDVTPAADIAQPANDAKPAITGSLSNATDNGPNPPRANKIDIATALGEVQGLTSRLTTGTAGTSDTTGTATIASGESGVGKTLQQRMLDNKEVSFMDQQIQGSAAVRRTVAFGEGCAYAVPGAVKAFANDVTHPTQLVEKGLMAASIGVAMRVLLPKTGAGKAIVGAVMGYYMVKDAVKPIINGWEESGKAQNVDQVNLAAQHIGDGLGAFAWDAWFGSKVGLKAEKFTGNTLDATLGTARFASFEKFKVDMDAKLVTKPLTFLLSPISRASDWASDKMVRKVEEPKIEFQAVKHQFAEVEAQNIARIRSVDLHLKGVIGADGGRLGFSETLDLLQKGHDPRNIKSTDVHQILGQDILEYPVNRVTGINAAISDALASQGITASTIPIRDGATHLGIIGSSEAGGFRGGDGAKIPSDAAKPPVVSGDAAATDKTTGVINNPSGKPYTTKGEKEVNAVNLGKLAAMNKVLMAAWDDKRVLIEDAKERLAGPVHAAISPEYKPMDKGYLLVRNQMMQLGGQISSEDDLKYVMPLFSRLSMASIQHVSDGLTNTASWKYQLDLMALETHSELVRNMKKAGIDPDVVLRSKNPAVFSISHDGGAGPHTMRQIDGVWNVDHVLYPRNMIDTRSTTASGIYSHELQHDQYGGILKFDESIREQVISDAVAKGLGARAKEIIHFPGVGDITKQDLLEAIFKAQADENTADIGGAAWTGHNSGGALGLLLQSLRKGGQLETRNVFGAEFKAADNPYGFEPHAFDAIRPKIVAAVMKARANGDARVIDLANALERYGNEASKSGDYVFANMDKPGETVTIPRKDMEDVIPYLIDAQLNTKLSALQGHSFAEILPDLPSNLAKMDTLADLMVDAIKNNKKPNQIPFDVSHYSIIQVFGAGLPAASRLVAGGMDATEANAAVNTMSDYLRGLYHGNDPHVDPLKPSALQTIRLSSPKTFVAGTARAGRDFVHTTGQVLGNTSNLSDWLAGKSTSYAARVGVIGVDQNYRNALTAQSLAQIDMTPVLTSVTASSQNNGTNSWLTQRDSTSKNLTATDQTRKEVIEGAQNQ